MTEEERKLALMFAQRLDEGAGHAEAQDLILCFKSFTIDEARALTTILREAAEGWRPTHRHKKRGSTYRVIGEAEAQVSAGGWKFPTKTGVQYVRPIQDGDHITVYQGQGGELWARFSDEFNDGRFEVLPAPPAE